MEVIVKREALLHRKAVAATAGHRYLAHKAFDGAIILLRQIVKGLTAREKSSPGFGLILR
jgi:hypothetical protein